VLLAEDGPDNQRLIALFLRQSGATVMTVSDGRAAVDAALAARDVGRAYDVVLMDMQMPIVDGYAATGQLRANGYTGAIVALTAHSTTQDRAKCIAAGCDEYVSKPVKRKTLIETVQRLATRRAPLPAC
jgi:CheY-like chemotaxis protein